MPTHQPAGHLPPSFLRFWSGEAVSGFGVAVTSLALPTVVLVVLQGGAMEVGWLTSARWLPYLVLGLVVGALVDRARRRPLMVVTDLTRAGLLGLVPLAWALDVLTLPVLLVVVVVFGTASLLNDAASVSFVPRLVPRTHLQRAHARLDGAGAVAQTTGPLAAGALIQVLGAPLAVLVNALTYVVSAVTVASLRNVPEPARVSAAVGVRGLVEDVGEGARWVYGGSGLGRLAVATHVWFAAQAVLLVVTAPYALLGLQQTPFQLGLVLAVAGGGALLGATTSTAVGRRLGTGGAISFSYLTSAAGVLVMLMAGLASSGWAATAVLGAGQLGHGWAMGVSNSHEMSYRQALTPDGLQARTNTTMRSLNRAVLVVVSPVAGLVAERVGYGPTLGAAAAVFAASALVLAASPLRGVRVD